MSTSMKGRQAIGGVHYDQEENTQKGIGDRLPLRFGLYGRVSTEEQAKEGMSIETQVSALRTWAKVKGWQVVGEYIDAGYIGGDDKRPELQRLMLDARRGAFQVVAVVKDRPLHAEPAAAQELPS